MLTLAVEALGFGRSPGTVRLMSEAALVAAGVLSVADEGMAWYRVFEARQVSHAVTRLDSVIYLPAPAAS